MPKTYLQKYTALLLSLILCFGLVGCNTTQNSTPQSTFELGTGADTPEEAVDMVMQAYFDLDKDTLYEYMIPGETSFEQERLFTELSPELDETMYHLLSSTMKSQSYELLEITENSKNEQTAVLLLSYYDCAPYLIYVDREWINMYGNMEKNNPNRLSVTEYLKSKIDPQDPSFQPELLQTEIILSVEKVKGKWYVHQPSVEIRGMILANYLDYVKWVIDLVNKNLPT